MKDAVAEFSRQRHIDFPVGKLAHKSGVGDAIEMI